MAEFLIRTTAQKGCPPIHLDRYAEVFMPSGLDCRRSDGWGDFRFTLGTAEFVFSGEDVGWQLSVEGDDSNAEEVVTIICRQIEASAGEPCEVLSLD